MSRPAAEASKPANSSRLGITARLTASWPGDIVVDSQKRRLIVLFSSARAVTIAGDAILVDVKRLRGLESGPAHRDIMSPTNWSLYQ